MSAPKLLVVGGLLAKVEASYGAGGSVAAATDGIQLSELAQLTLDWADAGAREMVIGSASQERRGVPSGRFLSGPVRTRIKGAGSAYSASNIPQDIHTLMRICGHSANIVTTAGAEKVTYAPVSSGYASAVGELYARGQKYGFKGAYGDLVLSAEAGQFGLLECNLDALVTADIADASVPTITYPQQAITPPKFENALVNIGSFASAIIRRFSFATAWERSPRLNANAGTHAGWSMIRRKPVLTLDVEMGTLVATPFHTSSGIDPYKLWEVGTEIALSFQLGSVQYNRLKFAGPKCQVVGITENDDAGQGIWSLNFQCNPSTPTANDEYSWVAD